MLYYEGLGLRVQGLGFRVLYYEGLGLRVQGLGFRVLYFEAFTTGFNKGFRIWVCTSRSLHKLNLHA